MKRYSRPYLLAVPALLLYAAPALSDDQSRFSFFQRNYMNSVGQEPLTRNEDLSSRDYSRTRAPYPVGAPPIYYMPEYERNRMRTHTPSAGTPSDRMYAPSGSQYQTTPPTTRGRQY
jgi:hypothetical protein